MMCVTGWVNSFDSSGLSFRMTAGDANEKLVEDEKAVERVEYDRM
jgi:hypothetical protein